MGACSEMWEIISVRAQPWPMADRRWAILGRRDVRGKGQGDEDDTRLAVPLARPGAPALGGDTVPGSMNGTLWERSFAVGCAGAGAGASGRCLLRVGA
jgi:hypothetical protein